MNKTTEMAVFGGGCFWCTEAVYRQLQGVLSVVPGYAGGVTDSPNYKTVCAGETGHAEVIQIEFDPSAISYRTLLEVFFITHDPTTLNRQGNDVGEQYRSIILYADEMQRRVTEDYISDLTNSRKLRDPIVTEVKPLTKFYAAEPYHHDYYTQNTNQPYCRVMISPKLEKLKKQHAGLLKK